MIKQVEEFGDEVRVCDLEGAIMADGTPNSRFESGGDEGFATRFNHP
jgi:hypothetical protein